MRGHVNLPPCLPPAQELMKVEAKWQCLTVPLKLCAGPGARRSFVTQTLSPVTTQRCQVDGFVTH